MQPSWSEVNEIIDYWAADNATSHPRTYANEWEDWLSVSRPGVFQDPDDVWFLSIDELIELAEGRSELAELLPDRREAHRRARPVTWGSHRSCAASSSVEEHQA